MTIATLTKESLVGASLQFQTFSPLSPRWEARWHAGRQVLKELRVLLLDPQAAGSELSHFPPRRPYLLQLNHTSFAYRLMGDILFKRAQPHCWLRLFIS